MKYTGKETKTTKESEENKMEIQEIFRKLYDSEITDEEAINLMDGQEAKEELVNLFNKRVINKEYYQIQ